MGTGLGAGDSGKVPPILSHSNSSFTERLLRSPASKPNTRTGASKDASCFEPNQGDRWR